MNEKFKKLLKESATKNISAAKLAQVFGDEGSLGIVLVGPEGVALTPFRNQLSKLQMKHKTDYELKMINASDEGKVKAASGYIADFKKDGRTTIAFVVSYDPEVSGQDNDMQSADISLVAAMKKANADYFVQDFDK